MKQLLHLLLVAVVCVKCTSPSNNSAIEKQSYQHEFQNTALSIDQRVDLLIDELTLEEKIGLMENTAQPVERLGIPQYNWWNEGLHGVARSAPATVFPQAIGMAATFNPDLVEQVATAISDEGRALYHAAIEKDIHKWYLGLTYWSPNVNIFRDPRWGRGHETYGEDPVLSGTIGASFVRGLQGNDDKYLKIAACAKHFAVHNGPEAKRHYFDASTNQKDLNETYLPAFKHLVDEGVAGVMCAYNRTNSEVCCGSPTLLLDVLRNQWNFDGYVVSDCGALYDFHVFHKISKDAVESAAMALKADVNVNCGSVYRHLDKAIEQGLVNEKELDAALTKQLKIRFQLGMFDPQEEVPYSKIPLSVVGSDEHKELSRDVARKSMVLLKNNGVLPLKKDLSQYYVTGNNAADVNALMGNYYGVSKNYVTVLEGIANAVAPTSIVQYNQTILLEQEVEHTNTGQVWNAQFADAVIAVVGISPLYEGENGDTPFSKTGGDRDKIELPANQIKLLKALKEKCTDKPLVVVVMSGSAIAMPEVHELADAIVWAWYPGEQGGHALADILFGDYSPSGKLPFTMYESTDQLGDFEDYNIAQGGWTYRYFDGEPLYPFGYGLSYNTVDYKWNGDQEVQMKADESIQVELTITNTGSMLQNESIQLYVSKTDAGFVTPICALKDFKNRAIAPGETSNVSFEINKETLSQIDMDGQKVLPLGEYKLFVGSSSPSNRLKSLNGMKPLELTVEVIE
ncbi:glycoside hydrolase family 3 C-terminal domain-containing protein [Carboxylicivirga sp. A043]|uniref:glycoside hydrolase family 3 C-terminal domain-containing protein n=1 Tax=Carboxylicivirga litoralis TaxID=2816963 RepID=UPI0021CB1B59|nr:glycoside hydrolase family 3 C-terminal domain-containing protein [Carboxylicivirga sp. A043]MCU4157017.1 glycoside hydrolase family 3 C-terminal domain-containing protein [Carboxylicivirga sp. A043]